MDEFDRKIINELQKGFPVCDAPYRQVAKSLGMSETELLARLKSLLEQGVLSRFGPMYHAERMGGALTLAAMEVPEAEFEHVTTIVNSFPEVAHNYRREHRLNMWFVLATDTLAGIEYVQKKIAEQTGLPVYAMPKIKEYFVNLFLPV